MDVLMFAGLLLLVIVEQFVRWRLDEARHPLDGD